MKEEFNPEIQQEEGSLREVLKAFFASKLDKQQTFKVVAALLVVCIIIFIFCLRNIAINFNWV